MVPVVFHQILVMFLILALGYTAFKTGIFTDATVEGLTQFLLQVIAPIVMFLSYQIEYSTDRLKSLLVVVGISAIAFAVQFLVGYITMRKKGEDLAIERLSVIYSNAGFFTIPLVWQLLGKEGVFYLTGYLTCFNILFWSHGIILVAVTTTLSDAIKSLFSPVLIGIFAGLVAFIIRLRIPAPVLEAMELMGNMNTPIAMLIAGATIAKSPLLDSFKSGRVYWVTAVKLLLLPIAVTLALTLLPIPFTMMLVIVLAASAPSAASNTMIAIKYKRNGIYASQIFVLTTLFSIITIPLIVGFAQYLNGV